MPSTPEINPSDRLKSTLDDVARQGIEMVDELVRTGREALQRQAEASRDVDERDNRARAVMALLQNAPDMRRRYPEALKRAFDRDLKDSPATTTFDTAPTSIRFDQLELMDENEVQERISAVRGVQQVLQESEAELAELNALMSAMLGFTYVRPERNPLRPEIFLDAMRDLLHDMPVDTRTQSLWAQVLLPQLGKQLRAVYRDLVNRLQRDKVQPARYSINAGAPASPSSSSAGAPGGAGGNDSGMGQVFSGGGGGGGMMGGGSYPAAGPYAAAGAGGYAVGYDPSAYAAHVGGSGGGVVGYSGPGGVVPPGMVAIPAGMIGVAPGALGMSPDMALAPLATPRWPAERAGGGSPNLTVEQLHGLMAGTGENTDQLAQEVVNLLIANIAGDPRVLPQVWQLIYELEPALLELAQHDRDFFHNKKHPARMLMEQVVQHSFAYPTPEATGFDEFLEPLQAALRDIDPAAVRGPEPFAVALDRLRAQWVEVEKVRRSQQEAAVEALKKAEQRNELARQIALHIQQQPETIRVPDVVVEFAMGPWAQVMAQARMEGWIDKPGVPDVVSLLEDLFWSVRPELTRERAGRLVRIIPKLIQGLREGLSHISYPEEATQAFFSDLFTLHQKAMEGASATRVVAQSPAASTSQAASAAPAASVAAAARPNKTWLAPKEASATGFMDDLESPEDKPAPLANRGAAPGQDFMATEPMEPVDRESDTSRMPIDATSTQPPETTSPAVPAQLTLEQLRTGDWVELKVENQWTRLQLAWANDQATLCLFSSAGGTNHSMTRRMFDRLVGQSQLRLVSQGAIVDRAFDAVAKMAMLNSVKREDDSQQAS